MINSPDISDADMRLLTDYQKKISALDDLQSRLDDVNAKIRKISFTKGTDRSLLPELNAQKQKLSEEINRADKKLFQAVLS